MTDINEMAQRMKVAALKAIADEGPTWFSKDQLLHPDGLSLHEADAEFIALASHENVLAPLDELEASQSENERLAKALTERNGEPVEGLVKRVAELEEIATDYGMKFQRAQDALKHQSLLHKSQLEAAEKRIAELEARAFNPAILDVIAERQRQQSVEGWTPEHDDEHCNGELAMAAVCYIKEAKPWGWLWDASWWKPKGRRRNLVKAGALIMAEIERIDRAAMLQGKDFRENGNSSTNNCRENAETSTSFTGSKTMNNETKNQCTSVSLTTDELSMLLGWMVPPYAVSDTHTDEFNKLRNKIFCALRETQRTEAVPTGGEK